MLKNNFINRQATLKIARALGELNSRVVFVGGAMEADAFFERGVHDVYSSADLEDIVYLFNYSTTLVKQISAAEPEVFTYLQQTTEKILADERILAAIRGHLYYETADERIVIIKEKMNSIVSLKKYSDSID